MNRPIAFIDVRDRDGSRGYHLLAALYLLDERIRDVDFVADVDLSAEEQMALDAFSFDRGVTIARTGPVGSPGATIVLAAIDAPEAIIRLDAKLAAAAGRMIAALSAACAVVPSVTLSGPEAHDTRAVAEAMGLLFDGSTH
jgi:hypothetical protein